MDQAKTYNQPMNPQGYAGYNAQPGYNPPMQYNQPVMPQPVAGQVYINYNQPMVPHGGMRLYSNSFFFCSTCVQNVPAPVAINSFFCVQNVLDIIQFVFWFYSFLGSSPKSSSLKASDPGPIPLEYLTAISYVGYAQIVTQVMAFIFSLMARSELTAARTTGSTSLSKTNISLVFYQIYLIINVTLYGFLFGFLFVIVFLVSSASSEAGGFAGAFAVIIISILLPYFLMQLSQLCQACKMKGASNDFGSNPALNSSI